MSPNFEGFLSCLAAFNTRSIILNGVFIDRVENILALTAELSKHGFVSGSQTSQSLGELMNIMTPKVACSGGSCVA